MPRPTAHARRRKPTLSALHGLWLACVIVAVVPFLDSARLTVGGSYVVQRGRDRLLLLAVELGLVALWALSSLVLRLDRALAPPALQPAGAWAGLALSAAGLGLAAWGKVRLGRWFTGSFGLKPGHELVTDGPYAVTRHPLYTGVLFAVAGSALVWNRLLLLVLAVVLVVPLWCHTVIEERMFVDHFGDAYRRYQRRVPRLVPFAPRPREDA